VFRNIEKYGAGKRIRTLDLRIPSASLGDLAGSGESQKSQNPCNIETSETEEKPEEA
jgi:hypothetical protein